MAKVNSGAGLGHGKTTERDYDREANGKCNDKLVKVPPSSPWPSTSYVGRKDTKSNGGKSNQLLSRHFVGRHAKMGR